LFTAGLKNISANLYEAAAIDGAGRWPVFRRITLPLLSPVMFFVIFILLINSFRVFGAVAIMTRGRPLGSTNVLMYLIYQQAFRFFDAGLAAANSIVVFVVILSLVLIQRRFGERFVFYR
jgi:ABC-type sugar transport system permease subunit